MLMTFMLMHSLPLLIVCGGIGAIIVTAWAGALPGVIHIMVDTMVVTDPGEVTMVDTLITVTDITHGMVVTMAEAMVDSGPVVVDLTTPVVQNLEVIVHVHLQ
jgi:hypothetical protein